MLRRCGLALLVTCVACNTNPARPDTRGGIEGVIVDCPTPVSGILICTARATCALYPCPGLPNRVVKDGYISQERTVTDGTIADFALDPSGP